jgi:hypothetical protein
MDARLIGAFAATPPAAIVRPARRMAMIGLLLMALTGSMLLTAEASHVALNPVFQIKAALIGLGLANALLVAGPAMRALDEVPAFAPLPVRLRLSALLSLAIWISVAACGRLIAYF